MARSRRKKIFEVEFIREVRERCIVEVEADNGNQAVKIAEKKVLKVDDGGLQYDTVLYQSIECVNELGGS